METTQPSLTPLRSLLWKHYFSVDVRRGARLLSPSPGTATRAQLRSPPLCSPCPRSGAIDREAVMLSAANFLPWHRATPPAPGPPQVESSQRHEEGGGARIREAARGSWKKHEGGVGGGWRWWWGCVGEQLLSYGSLH